MNIISYVKLSVALIGLFGMSLSIQAMDKSETARERQAARKVEQAKRKAERAKLIPNHGGSTTYGAPSINSDANNVKINVEKVKKNIDISNNLAQKTKTLNESTEEYYKQAKRVTVRRSGRSVAPVVTYVPQTAVTPEEPTIQENEGQEVGCFIKFFCCDNCEEE